MEAFSTEQPITSSGARMPQSPRRPMQQLPPRLNIHPAQTPDLGPPAQVQVCPDLSVLIFQYVLLLILSLICKITFAANPCASPVSGQTHSWRARKCCKSPV